MISRPCCVCGESRAQPLMVDRGVPIGRCLGCGLIYCVRIPDAFELASHYDLTYHDAAGWLRDMQRSRRWVFHEGLRRLRAHSARGRLLDVGCSIGLFLDAARRDGYDATGIEIAPKPARFAREHFGLEVHEGALESGPWHDGSFDVVTLWDVLEHVPDPQATLRQIARLLRACGVLAVRVPDGEFHLWKTRLVRPLLGARVVWMEVPSHLNHFRPRTLNRMMNEGGFDVLQVCPGPPHLWGKPIDVFKTAYYHAAVAARRVAGWQLGNCFEVYARRR